MPGARRAVDALGAGNPIPMRRPAPIGHARSPFSVDQRIGREHLQFRYTLRAKAALEMLINNSLGMGHTPAYVVLY